MTRFGNARRLDDHQTVNFDFDAVPIIQQCGRPTLRQTPCTINAELFVPGCSRHATEEEIKLGRLLLRAWQGGFRAGSRQNTDHLREQITALSNQVAVLKESSDVRVEDGGDQLIEVDGFAYRWTGSPRLRMGEAVILPKTPHSRRLGYPREWPGKVTALGTRYTGTVKYEVVSRKRYKSSMP